MELDQINNLAAQLANLSKIIGELYKFCPISYYFSTFCREPSKHRMPNGESLHSIQLWTSQLCWINNWIIHIQTHTTLNWETTPISLGVTINEWLDYKKILHNKRRSWALRIFLCNSCRRMINYNKSMNICNKRHYKCFKSLIFNS